MRFLLSLALLALVACTPSGSEDGDVKVATTVYPVEFLAREIGGRSVEVTNVTPPGAEPHDVELAAEQVIDLTEADLVVYVGADFQPAVEETLDQARGQTLDAFALAVPSSPVARDAHFWLDLSHMRRVAEGISTRLADIDPDNRDHYLDAGEDLIDRFRDLDRTFESGLRKCASHELVTAHEAFGQFAGNYGLTQRGISGLDPEAEPSPQVIAEMVDFVKANDIATIFAETLLPPDAAEAIAQETGAEVAVLDPLESAPESGDYFTAMELNLATLREALGCR